jgi:hypothetical protein
MMRWRLGERTRPPVLPRPVVAHGLAMRLLVGAEGST